MTDGTTRLTSSGMTNARPTLAARRARGTLDREGAAGARAEHEVGMATRRVDEVEDVAAQLGCDVDLPDDGDGLRDLLRGDDGLELVGRRTTGALGLEDRELGVAARVAHRDLHEEAVELRLGQGIGAFELDRVLRRDDHERARQHGTCTRRP